MDNSFLYLFLSIIILSAVVGIVFLIIALVKHFNKKEKRSDDFGPKSQNVETLKYSDKVKYYHGKNTETDEEKLKSRFYDENGKRKVLLVDKEKTFSGDKNLLSDLDMEYVAQFIDFVFEPCELSTDQAGNKIQRIMNSKEKNGETLLDVRYFFKNPKYLILPFHITADKRSNIVLYYCQTRAVKCVLMPRTKYSLNATNNYLAYFPIDSFDDMCFISYLMVKQPTMKGMGIHGFESAFDYADFTKYPHDKDFVFEYIYRMMIDYNCSYFPMANAFAETMARVYKYPGYPDASEWSSKLAEIKAEMVEKGLIKSGKNDENERKLFFIIKEYYPDAIYQYRDEWLGLYSLDIYIPSLKTAIEYQGGQHYKPVKFYGGKETFETIQRRDATKKELCQQNGIRIIDWKYDVAITKKNVESLLNVTNQKTQ